MKKNFFFILFASFSLQSQLFAQGCNSFLESKGFFNNIRKTSISKAWYQFNEVKGEYDNNNWIECKLTTKAGEPIQWVPFQGGNDYCDGKLFFSGSTLEQPYASNTFYDKNGNAWPASWLYKEWNHYQNISNCKFDKNSSLYVHRERNEYEVLVLKMNKYIYIITDTDHYFEKGVTPSF